MKYPDDSSSDEERIFDTLGSSINGAYLDYDEEEDVDDIEFDSMDDKYED